MRILVTGGAGYIGTHTLIELMQAGHEPFVVDNLSNSSSSALGRVGEITGKPVGFRRANLRDEDALEQVFNDFAPQAVIHFAGLKSVAESVASPLRYYTENVGGTMALLRVMDRHSCRTLVFSSSATVYGAASQPPFAESAPLAPANPYGRTKLMIEQILEDVAGQGGWRFAVLRYFNPVGAHPSGLIGEDPSGVPTNLFPYVARVAAGQADRVRIFGNDYDTPDGTGVRDYVHVCDVGRGHLAALAALRDREGCHVWNLGTGVGASVLDVLGTWGAVVGRDLPYVIAPRRRGDVAVSLADTEKARCELGWVSNHSLSDMCRDQWAWQSSPADM